MPPLPHVVGPLGPSSVPPSVHALAPDVGTVTLMVAPASLIDCTVNDTPPAGSM
jgi:hypothetical protein